MKAAIIGAGFMGNIHGESLEQVPQIQLKWVCDRHKGRGQSLAKKCGAEYTSRPEDFISDPETEVVIHALPTQYRLEYVRKYLNAGKHVLCEKPLALRESEADEISKLAQKSKTVFMTGQVVRFFPEYARARDMIRSERIGKPGIVRISRVGGPPKSFDVKDNWYLDYARSGGCLLDLAIHDLDWLLWTFGPVKRGFAQNLASSGRPVDYALGILKFKSGVLGHVEAGWAESPGYFHTSFEISGTGGLLEYDMNDSATLSYSPTSSEKKSSGGTVVPATPYEESPYVRQLRHFVECIENGKKPLAGVREGWKAVHLALKLKESSEKNVPFEM